MQKLLAWTCTVHQHCSTPKNSNYVYCKPSLTSWIWLERQTIFSKRPYSLIVSDVSSRVQQSCCYLLTRSWQNICCYQLHISHMLCIRLRSVSTVCNKSPVLACLKETYVSTPLNLPIATAPKDQLYCTTTCSWNAKPKPLYCFDKHLK